MIKIYSQTPMIYDKAKIRAQHSWTNLIFIILVALVIVTERAESANSKPAHQQNSIGGLSEGSQIVVVTTLEDDGPGSLRETIRSCGPCLIVFKVGGVIKLKNDLEIIRPHVTLAGETAPSPGVILHGASLRIRVSDVYISNLAIYSGSAFDPKIAENRDGVSIFGSPEKNNTLSNITLQNVSVGWGVDENISIQGLTDGMRVERSLIAHPLRHGGHPKGIHSMNLLLSGTTKEVLLLGNIFAGSEQRSPRITTGNRVSMLNNFIAGTGAVATHLDTSQRIEHSGAVDIIGNYYTASFVSNCKNPAIRFDEKFQSAVPQTPVYLSDNYVVNDLKPDCLALTNADPEKLSTTPLNTYERWDLIAAADVKDKILPYAGSRPKERNVIDQQVIQDILDGSIAPLENDLQKTMLLEQIPEGKVDGDNGFSNTILTTQNTTNIKTLLCQKFEEVTGLQSCPYRP
jgi:hypothetical protein